MQKLPIRWQEFLAGKQETGMGYQVVNILLEDGTKIEDVAILESNIIGEIKGGNRDFDTEKIVGIELTHNKWKFST